MDCDDPQVILGGGDADRVRAPCDPRGPRIEGFQGLQPKLVEAGMEVDGADRTREAAIQEELSASVSDAMPGTLGSRPAAPNDLAMARSMVSFLIASRARKR